MRQSRTFFAAMALAAMLSSAQSAIAESVADFYAGKTITIIVGYSAGGTYDATARLLSQYLGHHLPGKPSMIVKNMPGSGAIKAILHLANVAPHDGTALGMVARSYPIDPAFNPEGAKYNPSSFNPIGSTSTEVSAAVTWHTSKVKTFNDLMTHQATFGATGFRDDTGRFPMLAQRLTGAKIKVVPGYPGGKDVTLAMEKGEVEGRFGWSWGSIKSRSRAWLQQKKINIILQMGMKKASDLPEVPFIMDYAKTKLDKAALEFLFMPQAAAWPLIAPPDVPADRVAALRAAFQATMKDPGFLAKAERLRLDIDPVSGEEMAANNKRIAGFDHTVLERAKALTAPPRPTN